MDFFTSDLHLNHFNPKTGNGIIKYCNRPFSSIEEMNSILIDNWNSKIKINDTVYVLGDFIFGRQEYILETLNKLNGKIILIAGDHDKSLTSIKPIPIEVRDYLFYKNKNKNVRIALFHWCIRSWQQSHYNSYHCYGHSHGKLSPIGKSWDIGVDNNNFYPLSVDEVMDIMINRPDNPNLIRK
jgi:calcineurin-like phosphoesterase family protein